MAKGGKAAARVAEGIIAKAAKKIMPDLAEDALKAGAKDIAKDTAKVAGKDATKAAGKDAAEDAGKDAARKGARETAEAGEDTAKKAADRTATKDPIDIASGEVILHQVDVELPGVLPLVLERTHVSSYRTGRWFGTSWSSTLDQRLEVDDLGACLVAAEGIVLVYPIPMFGEEVMPERGPRWPLSIGENGYRVTDPQQGRTLHFAPQPNAGIKGVRASVLPLKAITDRNDNRVDLEYDGAGTLTELRHSGGYRIGVETADGRITAFRLLNAEDQPVLKRFGYNDAGRLTEVINSSGSPTRFEYDPAGRMTRWEDTNGYWYAYTYDEQGRGIAGRGSGDFLNATLTYHDDHTVVTDSLGQDTIYHLNERRQVIAEVDPLGNVTRYEWDGRNRLLSRNDRLGRTTRYRYDELGNLLCSTRPDGTEFTAIYNGLHLPIEITQPDGAKWRYQYDIRGNLIEAIDPLENTIRQNFDEYGAVIAIIDPLGAETHFERNAAGLPAEVSDPLGAVTSYERDAFGRVTAIIDPLGGVTRYYWDVEGNLTAHTSPSGVTEVWEYDGSGNPTAHIDGLGHASRAEYGMFNTLTAKISSDQSRLEFAYDTELRLVRVTGTQGLAWHYRYDGIGNLVAESDFNGRTLHYTHDVEGQLVRRTNGAGEITEYSRDALGQMIERRSSGFVTRYFYDRMGRLVRAVDPNAELLIQRDVLGRIVAESCNGRTLYATYDPMGRRSRRRTPSGVEDIWSFDTAGRPASLNIARHALGFTRDAAGREVRRHIGAGVILDQQYDADHHLISQAMWGAPQPLSLNTISGQSASNNASQARLLQHRTYSYRPDGTPTAIGDRLAGNHRFDLDRAGQVIAVHAEGWSEGYAYDSVGNIAYAAWSTTDQDDLASPAQGDREFAGTLIRRAGRNHYEFDLQGRLILKRQHTLSGGRREWRYAWDADDRLISVITPDGCYWRYRYDPLGRRIAKEELASDGKSVIDQTLFTWDGPQVVEEVRQSSATSVVQVRTWTYESGTFRPMAQLDRTYLRNAPQSLIDQRFEAIVTDLVGAPKELVSLDGVTQRINKTSHWGAPISERDALLCPLRFPGQYHDRESGLNYNLNRYYQPDTGSYLSADPIGLLGGSRPYGYVPNTAVWLDPLGLSQEYIKSYDCGGLIMATLDDAGNLSIAVEKGEGEGAVRGGKMFGDMMEHFGPHNIQAIEGKWVPAMPTNLDAFNANLRAGMSYEEAAKKTFTGHMSGKYGFTEASVDRGTLKGELGHHTNVEPRFTRPKGGSCPAT
ncbi:DUF6531 domain-containing protein [Actinoallomurus purpureus]|uniref:DUF6531 domain-containing protein n=1 Tax=Actinoallomurus purpureus TaxID=478114 RepID=UPI002093D6A6|nr:DUF6531 domain-containing protein [Actinoallomurus purpureus]MCO6011599.1 DUF6531 domain-containing protein [Actinoallomurus purpureus]